VIESHFIAVNEEFSVNKGGLHEYASATKPQLNVPRTESRAATDRRQGQQRTGSLGGWMSTRAEVNEGFSQHNLSGQLILRHEQQSSIWMASIW